MNTGMVVLTEFAFEEFPIRVVGTKIDPWFVGVDVATALGYKNPQEAVRKHVPEEDKGVSELLTPGGVQKIVVIDEAGLYYLIFKSKMQAAQRFTWWVTHEVLPSIRKRGYYKAPKPVIEKRPTPSRPPLSLVEQFEKKKKYELATGEKLDITELRRISRELGMPLEKVCDRHAGRMVEYVNEQMAAQGLRAADVRQRGYIIDDEPDDTYTLIIDGVPMEFVR